MSYVFWVTDIKSLFMKCWCEKLEVKLEEKKVMDDGKGGERM